VKEPREGNKILREEVIPYYNEKHVHEETKEIPIERWDRAIREGESRLRPVPWGVSLNTVFSLHYPRLVRRDGTIQLFGKSWKVGEFVGQRVTVAIMNITFSESILFAFPKVSFLCSEKYPFWRYVTFFNKTLDKMGFLCYKILHR
jgi:hypothetical protein